MSDWRNITRRDFVRDSALGALALGIGLPVARGSFAAAEGGKSIVALVRDEKVLSETNAADPAAVKKMLDEAVKTATGESSPEAAWKKLIKPDDIVGLVPTRALTPTHGELLQAVTDAIKAVGVTEDRILNVQVRNGKELATKCTALISIPGLKVHTLTGMGTVLKNYITLGENRASTYHKENNVALGEIWNMPAVKGKTRLVIVDALQALCAQGPQKDPKYMWNYNGLLVSLDPVAAEAIALKILQAKRNAFKGEPWEISPAPLCVAAADKQYGLGNSDPAKIDLKITGWEKDLLVS